MLVKNKSPSGGIFKSDAKIQKNLEELKISDNYKTLDAVDVYNSAQHILAWNESLNNILAIALKNQIYIWNAEKELVVNIQKFDHDILNILWGPYLQLILVLKSSVFQVYKIKYENNLENAVIDFIDIAMNSSIVCIKNNLIYTFNDYMKFYNLKLRSSYSFYKLSSPNIYYDYNNQDDSFLFVENNNLFLKYDFSKYNFAHNFKFDDMHKLSNYFLCDKFIVIIGCYWSKWHLKDFSIIFDSFDDTGYFLNSYFVTFRLIQPHQLRIMSLYLFDNPLFDIIYIPKLTIETNDNGTVDVLSLFTFHRNHKIKMRNKTKICSGIRYWREHQTSNLSQCEMDMIMKGSYKLSQHDVSHNYNKKILNHSPNEMSHKLDNGINLHRNSPSHFSDVKHNKVLTKIKEIQIFDAKLHRPTTPFTDYESTFPYIISSSVSNNLTHLAVISSDETLKIWTLQKPQMSHGDSNGNHAQTEFLSVPGVMAKNTLHKNPLCFTPTAKKNNQIYLNYLTTFHGNMDPLTPITSKPKPFNPLNDISPL